MRYRRDDNCGACCYYRVWRVSQYQEKEVGERMKQPNKLIREYKEAVAAYGLNPQNWMLQKDGDTYITIVHKLTSTTRVIDKYARALKGKGEGK